MNKMLSTYGLTRLPFSKDIPASEMLDTEALQAARERLNALAERAANHGQLSAHHIDEVTQVDGAEELAPAEGTPFHHRFLSCRLRLAQAGPDLKVVELPYEFRPLNSQAILPGCHEL